MKEYIERAQAIARFTFEQGDYIPEKLIDGHDNVIAVRTIKKVLREIPAADVAEVRHEKWVQQNGSVMSNQCGASPAYWEPKPNNPRGFPPFCHECGANMREENNND